MALKLTEQELKDLGFTFNRLHKDSSYKIWAEKPVGGNDAFFVYEEIYHAYDKSKWYINFKIVTITDRGYLDVTSDIETLERFHELENALNEK